MSKIEDWFFKIWKDPVWSKVIAEAIKLKVIAIAAAVGAAIYLALTSNIGLVKDILLFPVPLVLVVVLLAVGRLGYNYVKSKRDPILKEKYNPHYTFEELYNILQSQFLLDNTPERQAREMSVPTDNLLIQFYTNSVYLGKGVSINYPGIDVDGNYAWAKLYPKLMSYSMVYKKENDSLSGSERDMSITYHYSEQGIKFFQLLEKYFFKYPDAFNKARKNKANLG